MEVYFNQVFFTNVITSYLTAEKDFRYSTIKTKIKPQGFLVTR